MYNPRILISDGERAVCESLPNMLDAIYGEQRTRDTLNRILDRAEVETVQPTLDEEA